MDATSLYEKLGLLYLDRNALCHRAAQPDYRLDATTGSYVVYFPPIVTPHRGNR